jgi:hypothetical protein
MWIDGWMDDYGCGIGNSDGNVNGLFVRLSFCFGLASLHSL